MFNLTVEDASKRLGVGRARVNQLIRSGMLAAEKVGGIWLIDEQSVEARRNAAPKAGRPPASSSKGDVGRYVLMNRTHEVLSFRYDEAAGAFVDAGDIVDPARAPLGMISPRGRKVSKDALSFWWKHRCIPGTREGIDAKLAELGVDSPARIPFKSLGLSLSDQYWIRPENCEIAWEDVNYFDNDFCEMRSGRGWLDGVGLDYPDNTSEGELPKKWVCDGAKRLLVKGGSVLNQEPFNEAAASALYSRLLAPDEYVKYRLESRAGGAVCICENFVGSTEEYIPAYYVRQTMRQPNHRNDYQHYLECCSALDAERVEIALSKMIVCDDILGNSDRHWRNFGLVRDVETLRYRIAPLFDTGGSLWCSSTLESLRAHDFSFTTKPFYEDANRQLRLVNDYSWFDPAALEGFADELSAILSDNPALAERVDYICCAVQKRIDRIVRML